MELSRIKYLAGMDSLNEEPGDGSYQELGWHPPPRRPVGPAYEYDYQISCNIGKYKSIISGRCQASSDEDVIQQAKRYAAKLEGKFMFTEIKIWKEGDEKGTRHTL